MVFLEDNWELRWLVISGFECLGFGERFLLDMDICGGLLVLRLWEGVRWLRERLWSEERRGFRIEF